MANVMAVRKISPETVFRGKQSRGPQPCPCQRVHQMGHTYRRCVVADQSEGFTPEQREISFGIPGTGAYGIPLFRLGTTCFS